MPGPRALRDPFRVPKRPQLGEREIELLGLIADGLGAKEIGTRMGITGKGVEYKKTILYQKIGVTNAVSATRWAIRNGYVEA